MAYELFITGEASRDLDSILDYIYADLCNPAAATKFADAVAQSFARLEQNPLLYSLCTQPILRAAGYRKVVIGRYILIYRVNDERSTVYVERFFSELEDYAEKL